jgi:hypothetical protein
LLKRSKRNGHEAPDSLAFAVAAKAPLVETRTGNVRQLIESKSIAGLPLGNLRTLNVLQLSGAAVFVGIR